MSRTAWNAGFSRHGGPEARGRRAAVRLGRQRSGNVLPAPAPAPEPPPKPAPPPADAPPPVPDATTPKPAEEGAIFHALLDAGVEARLPYTAEKRMHSMTSETVAEHTRPILAEVSQLTMQVRDLAEMVRGLTEQVRDLAETVAEQHRTLAADIQALKEAEAEQDRKLDELAKAGAARDRKLDKLIAQTWLLLALMGVALILELAILGLLLAR